MLQRIQTIWLLLASCCGFAALKLPFYIGSIGNAPAEALTPMSDILILILTIAAAIVALVDIFIYRNRSLQLRIGLAGLGVSILVLILYFIEIKKYDTGGIALYSIFSFAVPVFFLLALRGIYKDQQLMKRVDRLR